jgi:hypothetical protein
VEWVSVAVVRCLMKFRNLGSARQLKLSLHSSTTSQSMLEVADRPGVFFRSG